MDQRKDAIYSSLGDYPSRMLLGIRGDAAYYVQPPYDFSRLPGERHPLRPMAPDNAQNDGKAHKVASRHTAGNASKRSDRITHSSAKQCYHSAARSIPVIVRLPSQTSSNSHATVSRLSLDCELIEESAMHEHIKIGAEQMVYETLTCKKRKLDDQAQGGCSAKRVR